jgi:hypothetical protein
VEAASTAVVNSLGKLLEDIYLSNLNWGMQPPSTIARYIAVSMSPSDLAIEMISAVGWVGI